MKSEFIPTDDPYAEIPIPRGPLEQEQADEWEQYAAAVSTHSLKLIKKGGPDPHNWPKQAHKNGSLVVIGAGIKCVSQFTVEALGHLKQADQVFFHVADPVTENYIRKMQPNAKDMSVLYGNKKERYQTYVQMAEVMLHSVRLGHKVVTIYYGHPGIFVFASHRAIKIAHKHGFEAKMLPGISALDCLFADLGIDPSYPGLQVFEATDFLVRKRKLLTDSHVIILQVGCVGDRGYRRQGYLMEHFHVLIEHLQSIYGVNYKITHYVASQFPSVRPVIENIPLSSLQDPEFVKKTIKGVSTFYISPKDVRKTDPEMAKKLGLHSAAVIERQYQAVQSPENSDPIAESDSKVRQQSKTSNQRNIANYGPREQKSLKMLSSWSVPGAYDFTPTTAAAKFMISLAPDPQKMEEFNKYSGKELQKMPGILPWQAKYLTSGNRAMVRLAVKPPNTNAAREAAIELFTNGSFAKAYAEEARKYAHDPSADQKLTTFLELHGFKTTPDAVLVAVKRLQQSSLLPWRQVYHTKFGNLEIDCQRPTYKGNVIWNEAPIQGFTFTSSTLSWKAEGVNESSAVLSFTTQDNLPIFNGKYWKKGEKEPSTANIVGTTENFVSPLSLWRGNYRTVQLVHGSQTKGAPGPELSVNFSAANPDGIVKLGGKPLVNFKFNQKKLSWENGEITFFVEKATVSHPPIEKFYGKIWAADQSKTSHFNFWGTKDATFLKPWSGRYKTYIGPNGKEKPSEELIVNGGLTVETSTVQFGKTINKFQFNNPVLSWEAGNGNDNNAQIRFKVFKNGSLGFKGMLWQTKEAKPMETNFEGVVDSIYLDAWCACYYTKVRETGDKVMDGEPFSITKSDNKCYRITYKGEEISNWNYSGAKRNLHWSSNDSNTNGSIQFYVPPPEKGTGLCFFGKVTGKGATIPVKTNIWGSTVPFPGVSANSTQQLEQLLENILTIALIEFLKYAWKKFKRWLKSKVDGEPKEQQEEFKKEYEDAGVKVNQLEDELNEENAKFDELEPEPPKPPDPAPEPPSNQPVNTHHDIDVDIDIDIDVDFA